MNKFVFFVLVCLVSASCAGRQENVVTLDSSIVKKLTEKTFFPDMIQEWDFVKLEASDSSLLAFRINIEFDEDKIFVATGPDQWSGNRLMVFDSNGKYLRDIGHQGRGPNEFLYVELIRLDRENKHVVIQGSKSIIKYDYSGNFIEQIDLRNETVAYPDRFYFLPDGNILLFHIMSTRYYPQRTYTLLDRNFKHVAELDTAGFRLKNVSPFGTSMVSYSPVAIHGNDVFIIKDLCDTVYKYNSGKLEPVCYLDSYGTMPRGFRRSNIKNVDQILEHFTVNCFKMIFMVSDHVLIYTKDQNMLIMDKSFKNGFEVDIRFSKKRLKEAITTPKMPVPEYYFDIEGVYNDRIYALINPVGILEYRDWCLENGVELSEKHKKLFDGMSENENPVLVFYRIKDPDKL